MKNNEKISDTRNELTGASDIETYYKKLKKISTLYPKKILC